MRGLLVAAGLALLALTAWIWSSSTEKVGGGVAPPSLPIRSGEIPSAVIEPFERAAPRAPAPPVEADVPVEPAATERRHPGLPVLVFGPAGEPLREWFGGLAYSAPPVWEVYTVDGPEVLGQRPVQKSRAHFERREPVAELGAADGYVGSVYLTTIPPGGRRPRQAYLVFEDRVVCGPVPLRGREPLEFVITRAHLKRVFGSVRARFRAADGLALDGAMIINYPWSGAVRAPVGADGSARLTGVPWGEFAVRAQVPGHVHWQRSVTLAPGSDLDLGLIDLERVRSVTGRIVGPADAIGGRLVQLWRVRRIAAEIELDAPHSVDSDANGEFLFEGLPGAEWIVKVVQRKQYRKRLLRIDRDGKVVDEEPSEDRETILTWQGPTTGSEHRAIREYGYELEQRDESPPCPLDTRGRSERGVVLSLVPAVDVIVVNSGECTVDLEVRDSLGFQRTSFSQGNAPAILRLVPGSYELRSKRAGAEARVSPFVAGPRTGKIEVR